MKTRLNLPVVFLLTLILSSCSTISYIPKVSLDVSPQTINKSVSVEKFVDNTSDKEKKNPFVGFSVTNTEALASDLSIEITNAVISDFHNNAVFKNISRRVENPDFIMRGEINKFKGKSQPTNYGLVSMFTFIGVYTWYFGIPIRKNETDIEIVVSLYNRNNELVGKYTGTYQDKVLGTLYKNKSLALPSQTNKSFSNVVSNIREQMMKDIGKIER